MRKTKTLHDVKIALRKYKQWLSVPANIVLADTAGNIGYMLLSSSPMRKNEYPYLGCRVHDGTTTEHDWEGIVDITKLPFVLNPERGYFITANNRVIPENSLYDHGSSMVSTGRA